MTLPHCSGTTYSGGLQSNPSQDLRSSMIADLAHDLTNPISSLRLRLYALKNAPESLGESLNVMECLVDQLDVLVKELVTLVCVGSESLKIHDALESHDLNLVVQQMVQLCQPMADSKAITLKVGTAPQALIAAIDKRAVARAIMTLISNVIEYSISDAEVIVTTRLENDLVFVSVGGTNIGRSSENMPRIFERSCCSKNDTDTIPCSRLDLSMVKEIAEKHGGQSRFSSDTGKGALFEIVLPAAHGLLTVE